MKQINFIGRFERKRSNNVFHHWKTEETTVNFSKNAVSII